MYLQRICMCLFTTLTNSGHIYDLWIIRVDVQLVKNKMDASIIIYIIKL